MIAAPSPAALAAATAQVDRSLATGDLLLAFDQAAAHLEHFPEDEGLKHRGVLALARAGATDRAAQLFAEWGLGASGEADIRALQARIAKDRALKLSGPARREALLEAASLYRRIAETAPDRYPAINSASLTFLAGDTGGAARIAKDVLADPAIVRGADYWALATRAEASLLVGGRSEASAALGAAAQRPDADAGARSSTRRQLRLILTASGASAVEIEAVLAPIAPPLTLHYLDRGGPGWDVPSSADGERAAQKIIAASLANLRPGAIFGSLGTPAEIIFAESALAAGIELTIVLPVPEAAFAAHFTPDGGPEWQARFEHCCRTAHRIVDASDDALSDDPGLTEHANRIAMGLALHRAQHLDGEAVGIVLAPEGTAPGPVEAAWTRNGHRQIVLRLDSAGRRGAQAAFPRQSCAVIFGDLPGFSRLPEKYLPIFWDTVMGAIGDVLQERGEQVALSNTWGDAIHLVVPDVVAAAEICLAVQRRLNLIDGRVLGRDEPPTMRIGAHYGPVFAGWDPIAVQKTYYGRALSRAARIEPITPPGTVYVTEAFAATLLLESRGEFACTYVGQVPLAKGFGTFRMYDLAAVAQLSA